MTEKFINFYPIIIKAKTPKLTQLFTVHRTKQWFYLTKVPIPLEITFFDLLPCLLSTIAKSVYGVKCEGLCSYECNSDELSIIENDGDRILNYVPINDSRTFSFRNGKCEKYSTNLIWNWNCQKVQHFMLHTWPFIPSECFMFQVLFENQQQWKVWNKFVQFDFHFQLPSVALLNIFAVMEHHW